MRRAGVAVFQHNFLARRQADVARRPQAAGPGQSGHRPPLSFVLSLGDPRRGVATPPSGGAQTGKSDYAATAPQCCPPSRGLGVQQQVFIGGPGAERSSPSPRWTQARVARQDSAGPRSSPSVRTGRDRGPCRVSAGRAGPGGEPGAESSSRTSCVALAASGGQVQAGPAASQVTRRSSIAERSARIRPGSALRRHSACGEAERPASAG